MTTLKEALETGNLDVLRSIPKSDLHNHAFLGGNREWITRATGRNIVPLNQPLSSMREMHEWVSSQIGALFNGAKGRLTAFEATFVQARYDGITRLEVGEDVWAITLYEHDAATLTRALA